MYFNFYVLSAFEASMAKAVTTELIVDSGSLISSDFCCIFLGFFPILLSLENKNVTREKVVVKKTVLTFLQLPFPLFFSLTDIDRVHN